MKLASPGAVPQLWSATSHKTNSWADIEDGLPVDVLTRGESSQASLASKFSVGALKSYFLVENYSEVMSKDYLPTRLWSFAHSFAAGAAGYCSTAAIVESIAGGAVGPLTVGLIWTLRNQAAKVGQVAGSFLAKMAAKNSRGWLKTSASIQRLCSVAEAAISAFPGGYLGVALPASIARAFAGVMTGAASAPIGLRQSGQEHLGELNTKDNNLNTVASTLGSLAGFWGQTLLQPALGPLSGAVVAALAATTQAVFYRQYLKALDYQPINQNTLQEMVRTKLVPSIDSSDDFGNLLRKNPLVVGQPLYPLAQHPDRLEKLVSRARGRNYLVEAQSQPEGSAEFSPYIVLHQGSTSQDVMLATWQGLQIMELQNTQEYKDLPAAERQDWLVEKSLQNTPLQWDDLCHQLGSAGWSTDCWQLGDTGKRALWRDEMPPSSATRVAPAQPSQQKILEKGSWCCGSSHL